MPRVAAPAADRPHEDDLLGGDREPPVERLPFGHIAEVRPRGPAHRLAKDAHAPRHGRTRPRMAFSRVVSPLPGGPTRPVTWPAGSVRETSRKAGRLW